MILDAILGDARQLYYTPRNASLSTESQEGPLSLHTILSRYLRAISVAPWTEPCTELSSDETLLLQSKGYSPTDVEQWAACLFNKDSIAAAAIFRSGRQSPPFFLVLLFLRRKRIRALALGIVLRHVSARLAREDVDWVSLKALVLHLLRHARLVWPESIPYIASLFSAEASKIYSNGTGAQRRSSRMLRDLTRFSNELLSLLSLPVPVRPVISSLHQEKAQFEVLRFMASCSPALVVSQRGFKATTRNQLAHSKTAQEREWAALKGPSWPPWKQNRTAMDDEKGYEFGSSRASRILHRMYEAGYDGSDWAEIVQIYAGWDTDLSPTIQTRAILPSIWARARSKERLQAILWAARIKTTRTRREAWACFLAYETSDSPLSSDVYLAMFEKLHYPEIHSHEADGLKELSAQALQPGDMKEVLPDPKSPLHLVHVSEPVPTYMQLYHRMMEKGLSPSGRLIAFLVDTIPDFSAILNLLEAAQDQYNGGIRCLLQGTLSKDSSAYQLPDYLLGSFVRFLCRFGYFPALPPTEPVTPSLEEHQIRVKMDQGYLLEYAYTVLMHFRPPYRPAWTAYMWKVLSPKFPTTSSGGRRTHHAVAQYATVSDMLRKLEEIELDPDDEQFQVLCTITRYSAQAIFGGKLSVEDAHSILSTAPRQLRTIFHNLVGASADPDSPSLEQNESSIPPPVLDPTTLHAYVRALGSLRDYEGLYSFSTWATTYHAEVTARANAQHSGPQALYRTLVALRAALEGLLCEGQEPAPRDLIELIKAQIESVEEWGWPSEAHVALYMSNKLRSVTPGLYHRR